MIYLASRSPRRRELLTQIGVRFEPLLFREGTRQDSDTDEAVLPGEQAADYVQRVSRLKCDAAWQRVVMLGRPRRFSTGWTGKTKRPPRTEPGGLPCPVTTVQVDVRALAGGAYAPDSIAASACQIRALANFASNPPYPLAA